MQEKVLRKLFLAFIEIHILQQSKKEPIYGNQIMENLEQHGYTISAGTLYPIFHNLERDGLLIPENKIVNGKARKYYSITEKGICILEQATNKIGEFTKQFL